MIDQLALILNISSSDSVEMNLPELFSSFVFGWLKHTEGILVRKVHGIFEKGNADTGTQGFHMTSVVNIFQSSKQALEFMKSLELSKGFYVAQFAEVII